MVHGYISNNIFFCGLALGSADLPGSLLLSFFFFFFFFFFFLGILRFLDFLGSTGLVDFLGFCDFLGFLGFLVLHKALKGLIKPPLSAL